MSDEQRPEFRNDPLRFAYRAKGLPDDVFHDIRAAVFWGSFAALATWTIVLVGVGLALGFLQN